MVDDMRAHSVWEWLLEILIFSAKTLQAG